MKIKLQALMVILVLSLTVFFSASCSKNNDDWKYKGYDLALPDLENDPNWYATLIDNFEEFNQDVWTYSPHALRWETNTKNQLHSNHWCDHMVEHKDGKIYVKAYETTKHECEICPEQGRFSGGIETRKIVKNEDGSLETKGTSDEILFSQAFGYFEARVKFPDAPGLWSAFWLQSSNQRKVGSEGMDGTEIDIFESAFRGERKSVMGHALLWDGYGKDSKVADYIGPVENLYDASGENQGFNVFALKWTPLYYVFYVNGKPTWATNAGGVSRVKQFLRLTVEIDAGDKWGPHGMKIGAFKYDKEPEFVIDYVKVYQNKLYEPYIIEDSQFPGDLDFIN